MERRVGELVRLVGMPNTEWHAPTRTWRPLDGTLGRVRQIVGRQFPRLVVDLYRRHRGTGKPLPPKTVTAEEKQTVSANDLNDGEEQLVEASEPLFIAAAMERDRQLVGGALWLQGMSATEGGNTVDRERRDELVAEVKAELEQGARGSQERLEAIRRWFGANRPLLLLAAQLLLARRPTSPTPTDLFAMETPLQDDLLLAQEGEPDSAEVNDWLHEPRPIDDEELGALRLIELWTYDDHFDARYKQRPEFDALYEPYLATSYRESRELYVHAVGNVAYLLCPQRVLLSRCGQAVFALVASLAPHLEYARRKAGWDFRDALMAALYDTIYVLYCEGQPPLRAHLSSQARLSLRHSPLSVLLFAVLYYVASDRVSTADSRPWNVWKAAKWVGDRSDGFPLGQAILPGFPKDTPLTALWAGIAATLPDLARRLAVELEGLGVADAAE